MATFSVNGNLIPATTISASRTSLSSRRNFLCPSSFRLPCISTPSPRFPYLKCSSTIPDHGPDSEDSLLLILGKSLAAASVLSIVLLGVYEESSPNNGGGGGGDGGSSGGSGGGGDGNDGGFWRKLFSPAPKVDDDDKEQSQSPDWDSHGLPENITVKVNKLSAFKKYKITEITFFDQKTQSTTGTDDSFFQMLSIRPDGVYSKSQLREEIETLASSGLFEKVDMEGKTKPDGTLGVTISFVESIWPSSVEKFRCISSDKEMPCLLPSRVQREVLKMLKGEERINARLLMKIRDRVHKWYRDQGYVCAQLVSLATKEMVCEVVEGDITQLAIKIQDHLGNAVQDSRKIFFVRNILPKQLCQGSVYNIKAAKQALRTIESLKVFSRIEIIPRLDEKKKGSIIVDINLKEKGRPK